MLRVIWVRICVGLIIFGIWLSGLRRFEVVLKLAGKKTSNDAVGEITVGSLSIDLDAAPFHELTAIEAVVRSFQKWLLVLQKAREALKWLDQLGDTEVLKYVVENEGVPECILFKIT